MTSNTIDLTPTWAGLLPALLAVLENGSAEGRKLARAELRRMAQSADLAVNNAALIAAAPDLLEQLVRICDLIEAKREGRIPESYPIAIDCARAAIAKATGTAQED